MVPGIEKAGFGTFILILGLLLSGTEAWTLFLSLYRIRPCVQFIKEFVCSSGCGEMKVRYFNS